MNARPDDWQCPNCNANVFGSRAVCFRCDTPNPAGDGGGSGGYGAWQGLDGAEGFEAGLAADEEAYRAAFGPAHSSGIDFSSYSEIPVEVELPRSVPELSSEMQSVEEFAKLRCGAVLSRNLRFAGFTTPTPVQGHSVPLAIGGLDVISVAQTGSGKTLAFMLPILRRLLELGSAEGTPGYRDSDRHAPVAVRALVLAPTRELAQQIREESKKFAFRTGLRVGVAYGGTPFGSQMRELERGCDVLIATPGRLDDMIERGRVTLRQVRFLVLDEADRMLDMGFEPQIRNIIEQADMPPSAPPADGEDDGVDGGRQTMMFSATFPPKVRMIAQSFLLDPVMLKVGRVGGAATSVTQRVEWVEGRAKMARTLSLLEEVPGKTIVFVNTKRAAEELELTLQREGTPAASVHGDKEQRQRERALRAFKEGHVRVLVGTDVLGRGIDVPEVAHVINYDAPTDIEDYTHRIGRTGRAGHQGISTTMLNGRDGSVTRDLQKMLIASKQDVPEFLADLVPSNGRGGGRRGRGRGGGRGGRGGGRRFGGDGGRNGGGGGYGGGSYGGGGYGGGGFGGGGGGRYGGGY